MDSDILFHKKGLLDDMKKMLPEKFIYCGKIGQVTKREMGTTDRNSILYINEYLQFPLAKLHGAPFNNTFSNVKEQGKENLLINFEVSNYINHLGRGTVIRTGGYHRKNHPKYSDNK